MLHSRSIIFRPGENVIDVVRRSWWTTVPTHAISLLLIVFNILLAGPLFRIGSWGIGLFFVIIIFAIALSFRAFWEWFGNAIIVTDERCIDFEQHGWFRRSIKDVAHTNVDDVRVTVHGVADTLFRLGTITIDIDKGSAEIVLDHVSRPVIVQDMLEHFRQEARKKNPDREHDVPVEQLEDKDLQRLARRIDLELKARDLIKE
jgi:hypothetical protein